MRRMRHAVKWVGDIPFPSRLGVLGSGQRYAARSTTIYTARRSYAILGSRNYVRLSVMLSLKVPV